MELSQQIKELRVKHGLTQTQLANAAGLAQSVISHIENGEREPTLESLAKLCAVFHMPLSEFFALLEEHSPSPEVVLSQDESALLERLRQCSPDIRRRTIRACIAFMKVSEPSPKVVPLHGAGKADSYQKKVEGEAAAGCPITAVPEDDLSVSVPQKYLDECYFIIRARGNSMSPTIPDGAFCVFQRDAYSDDGCIILAQIDGSTDQYDETIKRIYLKGTTIELRSDNPDFETLIYPTESVHIAGTLVKVL